MLLQPLFFGLRLECGALGRQYPLTPSNMGLEYLIPFPDLFAFVGGMDE